MQCLDRRLPDLATLTKETQQWEQRRNAAQKGVDWQFSTLDAGIKLKRLYSHRFKADLVLDYEWELLLLR